MRRSLPQLARGSESLGQRTIMDRALALKHGVRYVHLAVFAIDVDRVRDHCESLDDALPFAWEVFLTEIELVRTLDPRDPDVYAMIEDVVLGILELGPSEEGILGTQLPFSVWHAVERGAWPAALGSLFRAWKARPKELGRDLAPLFGEEGEQTRALAQTCLTTAMSPPLAGPTLAALEVLTTAPTRLRRDPIP